MGTCLERNGKGILVAVVLGCICGLLGPGTASAQECFIGEVRMFAGNFAPRSWAFCNGQLLAINSFQALFSILGTTYGGDGRTTFALPDLRGRVPIHAAHGPGLSDYNLGEKGGVETVTLTQAQIPAHNHNHQASASSGVGDTSAPAGNVPAAGKNFYSTGGPDVTMSGSTTGNAGGSQPHENRQPYLGINYIICLYGIFPSRD